MGQPIVQLPTLACGEREAMLIAPTLCVTQQYCLASMAAWLSSKVFPAIISFLGSLQFSSVAQSCLTLHNPMNRSMPGLPVHHQLPDFTQTHVHRVSDAIQPSHPLASPSPPAPNPSQHQSLFNESTLRMKWLKYWSFSFSIIPAKEISGLISFRMDWKEWT